MHSMIGTIRDLRLTLNAIEQGNYVNGDRAQLARLTNDVLRMTKQLSCEWVDSDSDSDSDDTHC